MSAVTNQEATQESAPEAAKAPAPVTEIRATTVAALLIIAPKHEIRYYLRGIYFDPAGYAVATDGSMMLAARAPTFSGDGFIVPRDVAESVVKSIKPRDRSTRSIQVFRDRFGAMLYEPIDGRFPDWRHVMPTNPSGERAFYNPELLVKMRDALRICGHGDHIEIAENGGGPGVARTHDDFAALVMPMRGEIYGAATAGESIAAFLRPAGE